MTTAPDVFNARCVSRAVLDRIAQKWPMLVVYALAGRALRYAELERRIGGISQKMLSQTLRQMERDGLVSRRVLPATPPAVEYRLTALGESLREPLGAICRWPRRTRASCPSRPPRHRRCARPERVRTRGCGPHFTVRACGRRVGSLHVLRPNRETT